MVAKSLHEGNGMLADLIDAAKGVGLEMHPDKTKILHNQHITPKAKNQQQVHVDGMNIEILPITGSTKYLGRKLSFHESHSSEIEHRIALAWRKFYKIKQELTGRSYSLSDRLRLFHGVITPTILYGAEAWTLTVDLENRIQRTQG